MNHIQTFLLPKNCFYRHIQDESIVRIVRSKMPPDLEYFFKSHAINYSNGPHDVDEHFYIQIEVDVYSNKDKENGEMEGTFISNPNITMQYIPNTTGEMDELKFFETEPAFRSEGE